MWGFGLPNLYKLSVLKKEMSTVAIIVKIMPDSPETNLESIKKAVRSLLEQEGAMNLSFEERPIAFGLKAVMLKMAWPEEKDTSIIEDKLSSIEHVSSADIEDYRRAFG
jgi:elongation factor 1-beta